MARTVTLFSKGDFKNLERFLDKMKRGDIYNKLGNLGQQGVNALANATPKASGITADSWGFVVEITQTGVSIEWTNTNIVNGFNVAVGLQYGHGTGTGGWVSGIDYINPALKPIFEEIANQVWKEVTSA